MASTPITDPDLASFAGEHLEYEANMYLMARNKLFQQQPMRPPTPDEAFNRNLLIESCILHFRNLVDFFYPPSSPQPDDVTASDYIPGWNSPRLPDILKDARNRANKELAHLTLKRRAGALPNKAWDFADLSNAMTPVITDFVTRVAASTLNPQTKAVLLIIGGVVKVTGGPVFNSTSV